jgi:transcription elongation factor Elf1
MDKEELREKWNALRCPVCGNEHMEQTGHTYSLLNEETFMKQYASDKAYKVSTVICKECGYVVLRKAK